MRTESTRLSTENRLRVHIIEARAGKADRVLSRLAADLAMATGWSLSDRVDPRADCNVFLPYLELKGPCPTPSVAWFTHLEQNVPEKADAWVRAAELATVRTTSARMYADMLASHGPTLQIPPALDLARFTPSGQPKPSMPRVGLSGFVYASGRKGEGLLKDLVRAFRGCMTFVASGVGWPISNEGRDWASMPDFYRSLSVLLCTSTVEGIPMPPLEALACGVPIVVPFHVGMMDELGEHAGIYRYHHGDADGLAQAIEQAVENSHDPQSLREIVAGYTRSAWGAGFAQAVEMATTPQSKPPAEPISVSVPHSAPLGSLSGTRGIYLVAFGAPAKECARRCVASIRAHMPAVPICLVSDEDLGIAEFPVVHAEEDIGARHQKTEIYDLAPEDWESVVYLDADTELVGPIDFLFEAVERGWELAICYNPAQYVLAGQMRRPDNGDEIDETVKVMGTDLLLQYNGGVFAFRRSERVEAFFHRWHTEWDRWGKRDQAAFDRALYAAPLRVLTLGVEWNTVTRYLPPERSAGILHHPTTARRWHGILHERTAAKDLEKQGVL